MPTLTYHDLVQRLTDLRRLADPPIVGERSGTFSSYDRRSRFDATTQQYIDWDANDDGTGYIRREDEYIVVFEQTGPGVIWRVWSAFAAHGHIQIFIDGSDEPVVDMPCSDFFGRHPAPLNPMGITNVPELTPTLSRGRNRFLPIPFQHACKIRFAPNWGMYYHFTYTTFPADTQLPSYDGTYDSATWKALAYADRTLAQRGYARAAGERIRVQGTVGSTPVTHVITGNRAITGIYVSTDALNPAHHAALLHDIVLDISWDDDPQPSVSIPLGHLFGSAPGVHYHRTLSMGMTTGYGYCHWYMPFHTQAVMTLRNRGTIAHQVDLHVTHEPVARDTRTLLRFHAKWHGDMFLDEVQQHGRNIDWPILLTHGVGRFCGMYLHVHNQWQEPSAPAPSWWYGAWDQKNIDWWWGEGDEKFFVDGEHFPSTFGTGSEDYVGYAWAAEPPFPTFESAYASQPQVPIDGNGHTGVCRVHICDDVPFQQSFEASIEKYKPNSWGEGNVCRYDVVAFWYQQAGTADRYA